jgi:hypothetical protein
VMVECKTNPASVPRTTVRGRVNGQGHGNGTLGASRASGDRNWNLGKRSLCWQRGRDCRNVP